VHPLRISFEADYHFEDPVRSAGIQADAIQLVQLSRLAKHCPCELNTHRIICMTLLNLCHVHSNLLTSCFDFFSCTSLSTATSSLTVSSLPCTSSSLFLRFTDKLSASTSPTTAYISWIPPQAAVLRQRRTHYKVPLRDLCIPDLLVERVVRDVYFGKDARVLEFLHDVHCVCLEWGRDGDDDDLSG
jgi:hypothetical protein